MNSCAHPSVHIWHRWYEYDEDFPALASGMVLISLLMVGVTSWPMCWWRRSCMMNRQGGISLVLSLGWLIWAVSQFCP